MVTICIISVLLIISIFLVNYAKKKVIVILSALSTFMFIFMLIGKVMPYFITTHANGSVQVHSIKSGLENENTLEAKEILKKIEASTQDGKLTVQELNEIADAYIDYRRTHPLPRR